MNELVSFTGGKPDFNIDDMLWNDESTRLALEQVFRAFGDNYIIQGVTGTTSISSGYIMLAGEILKVDAHTKTNNYFAKVVTYDAGGDVTFNDGVARQTWQKNRATVSAGSGSLFYSVAKRMQDKLVDTITAGTSTLAPANLPKATTALEGILETATATEANALSVTNKIITPGTIPTSTSTQKGVIEIATYTEIGTGSDTTRSISPSGLGRVFIRASSTGAFTATGGTVNVNTFLDRMANGATHLYNIYLDYIHGGVAVASITFATPGVGISSKARTIRIVHGIYNGTPETIIADFSSGDMVLTRQSGSNFAIGATLEIWTDLIIGSI